MGMENASGHPFFGKMAEKAISLEGGRLSFPFTKCMSKIIIIILFCRISHVLPLDVFYLPEKWKELGMKIMEQGDGVMVYTTNVLHEGIGKVNNNNKKLGFLFVSYLLIFFFRPEDIIWQ